MVFRDSDVVWGMLLLSSLPVVSDSLQPSGLQHARPSSPSPSPGVCPSSCSLHWWCHPAISFSDTLFFCPQSFPASGTFPVSHLSASDDQNTGVSASVLPVNIQGWSPLRLIWFDLLAIQGTFRSLLQHHSSKASVLWHSAFFTVRSWNQNRQEKHQQPQICRWYHSNGWKWRETKEPLDNGEGGELKSLLKTKY